MASNIEDEAVKRFVGGDRGARLLRHLETEVWPQVPPEELGRRLSRAEEEAILGYGPPVTALPR